ncbi:hypothetical protein PDQ75_24895 [Bacillus cereus group sp. Bc015]|uniref:hypothetical protein n=1 Tax=Bacillus cereus group sp. Bc015 TaxID=3018123 RepID=UPI0022E66AE4|nr:hypothetical protein [Bacillus cereus group sp. Bc015]MDA2738394.1 hypothetical protein [Bacillus cereus group sp. Bc015]
MKKSKVYLSDYVRVSVVEWSENDISVETQFNSFPTLDPRWEKFESSDERDLSSPMQVYGYIEEMKEKHL